MRFIARFNGKTDGYHTYFTNIPENDLLGKDIASLYSARWWSIVFAENAR